MRQRLEVGLDHGGRRDRGTDHRCRGAATTEAPASSGTPSSESAAASFQVPTTSCPADATTPLADGAPIKIGFVEYQTGPLAAFGQIAPGMKVLFDR